MHILIAGFPESTINYQHALHSLRASSSVSLSANDCSSYDGLLLPGGGDIHPAFWNEEITFSRNIDYDVDLLQFHILKMFVDAKKPILGICKGMQLINVFFNGSVHQHLHNISTNHEYKQQDNIHFTHTFSLNIFSKLYGYHFITNSAHHQGIHLLGENVVAMQYADDGVIEGICHSSLPIIGVQWHPERMCFSHARKDTVDGSLLLAHFLELCS